MGRCLAVSLGILWEFLSWFTWQLPFDTQILSFHCERLTEKELINMRPGVVNNGEWLVYTVNGILETGKAKHGQTSYNAKSCLINA